jgi:hypothetical protein
MVQIRDGKIEDDQPLAGADLACQTTGDRIGALFGRATDPAGL